MTAEEALAQKAEAESQAARSVAIAKLFGPDSKRIPAGARAELLKALTILASTRAFAPGETHRDMQTADVEKVTRAGLF